MNLPKWTWVFKKIGFHCNCLIVDPWGEESVKAALGQRQTDSNNWLIILS